VAKATEIAGLSAKARLREAGPRILTARLHDVEQFEAALPGVEAVHDMRVAIRRLRAALRLLGLRELDVPVKKLQDALGEVRDLQVQTSWLAGRDDALARRREVLLRKADRSRSRAVGVWESQTLPRVLEAASSAKFKGKLSGPGVRKLLRKRLARFDKRLEAALERPDASRMHAVRRTAKQLRYLFELAQPAFRAVSKILLAELLPLQESLGELHDVDVRLRLLHDKPLLREQREDRDRLVAIVAAQLTRWKNQKVANRARRSLTP
jgi:CHAD domain-containing protein